MVARLRKHFTAIAVKDPIFIGNASLTAAMSLTTKIVHTICKSMCSMSLGMGVLMFGHGVGLLDAPDKMMTHTQNGEGVSKFDWLAEQATEQLGTPN